MNRDENLDETLNKDLDNNLEDDEKEDIQKKIPNTFNSDVDNNSSVNTSDADTTNNAEVVKSGFPNETISTFNSHESTTTNNNFNHQPYIQDYSKYKHHTNANSYNGNINHENNVDRTEYHSAPYSHSYQEFIPPTPQYFNNNNSSNTNPINQPFSQQREIHNINYSGQQPYTPNFNQNNNVPYYKPYQQPQQNVPKVKMRTSIKLLIGGIISLFLLCVVTILVITIAAFNNGLFDFDNSNILNGLPTQPTEESIEQTQPDDSNNEPNPYIDPDSQGIETQEQPEDIDDTTKYSASYAFEKCSPSIASVLTFEEDTQISEGTGVIISEDGYIVTNSHVINDSSEYDVSIVIDSNTYVGSVVGFDTRTDLAVIKITPDTELIPAVFANSDSLKIGQEVVAIGNPGGVQFSKSITKGIISALDRQLESGGNVSYIQTDAAINPGNSGGPLVNLNGEVIGINTIKISDQEYEGMGFAIPSNTVEEIVDELIKNGKIEGRTRLGIKVLEINEYTAKENDLPTGVQIESFESDSTLEADGASVDDIITHIDGTQITGISQLYAQLEKYKPGDEVELTLYDIEKEESYKIKTKLLAVE